MQISNLEHLQVADLEELKGGSVGFRGFKGGFGGFGGFGGLGFPGFGFNQPSVKVNKRDTDINIYKQDINLHQTADSVALELGGGYGGHGGVISTAHNNATIMADNGGLY